MPLLVLTRWAQTSREILASWDGRVLWVHVRCTCYDDDWKQQKEEVSCLRSIEYVTLWELTLSSIKKKLRRITRGLLPIVLQKNDGPARNHVLFFGSPISEQFCSPFDLAVNLEPPTFLCKRIAKYFLEQLDLSSTKYLRHETAVSKEIRCPLSH